MCCTTAIDEAQPMGRNPAAMNVRPDRLQLGEKLVQATCLQKEVAAAHLGLPIDRPPALYTGQLPPPFPCTHQVEGWAEPDEAQAVALEEPFRLCSKG